MTNRYRRSDDRTGIPLAPKVVMEQTRGRYAGPVTVTVAQQDRADEEASGRSRALAA